MFPLCGRLGAVLAVSLIVAVSLFAWTTVPVDAVSLLRGGVTGLSKGFSTPSVLAVSKPDPVLGSWEPEKHQECTFKLAGLHFRVALLLPPNYRDSQSPLTLSDALPTGTVEYYFIVPKALEQLSKRAVTDDFLLRLFRVAYPDTNMPLPPIPKYLSDDEFDALRQVQDEDQEENQAKNPEVHVPTSNHPTQGVSKVKGLASHFQSIQQAPTKDKVHTPMNPDQSAAIQHTRSAFEGTGRLFKVTSEKDKSTYIQLAISSTNNHDLKLFSEYMPVPVLHWENADQFVEKKPIWPEFKGLQSIDTNKFVDCFEQALHPLQHSNSQSHTSSPQQL